MIDYSCRAKDQWRHWVWNRISERIPKVNMATGERRSQATVLYLVGPDDHDRELAISKGFADLNVIAVDIDRKCVAAVRQKKHLGICGRLEDLLTMWPADWPIDAVLADFTCGLDRKTMMGFMASLFVSRGLRMGRTVLAVNIQRGRDPDSNSLWDAVAEHQADHKQVQAVLRMRDMGLAFKTAAEIITDDLHRGRQMLNVFLTRCFVSVKESGMMRPGYVGGFVEMTNPVFQSYRQTVRTPFMDSVVFTMPPGSLCPHDAALRVYFDITGRDPRGLAAKIAACRAVRTMRLNGQLATQP